MKLIALYTIVRKTLPLQIIPLNHEFSKQVCDVAPNGKKIGFWGKKKYFYV